MLEPEVFVCLHYRKWHELSIKRKTFFHKCNFNADGREKGEKFISIWILFRTELARLQCLMLSNRHNDALGVRAEGKKSKAKQAYTRTAIVIAMVVQCCSWTWLNEIFSTSSIIFIFFCFCSLLTDYINNLFIFMGVCVMQSAQLLLSIWLNMTLCCTSNGMTFSLLLVRLKCCASYAIKMMAPALFVEMSKAKQTDRSH